MMKTYLINLDQDTARLAFFASTFQRLGLPFERVPGIDGRLFSEADYQAFMRARPRHDKTWLRGQMGCFLSHHAVWEKIANGEDRFCAVFEDDIHASDDLKKILADDQWIGDDIDIIRLETSTNRLLLRPAAVLSRAGRGAFAVCSTSWCAGAYLIHRRTAQQLLALPARDHEPADVLLYNFEDSAIAGTLKILQFDPAPCTQDKHLVTGSIQFSSNIESASTQPGTLKRLFRQLSPMAVGRAIYRTLRGYRRIGFF
jgi:glycosyl transferase family 25